MKSKRAPKIGARFCLLALFAQSVVRALKRDYIRSAKLALLVAIGCLLAQYANKSTGIKDTRTPYTTQYLKEPLLLTVDILRKKSGICSYFQQKALRSRKRRALFK